MPCLLRRYFAQLEHIKQLEAKHQNTVPVRLLAVSKTKPASDVLALYKVGQRDFGENYLQEALEKQKKLAHLMINWHFIGPIQSNKTRDIAKYFQWVHSIDRLKIAQRLHQQRPSYLPPLNICLQVNIDVEKTKAGFLVENLAAVVEPIRALNNLRLRGLMVIPKAQPSLEQQRQAYQKISAVKDELNERFEMTMDTLSMGMSADLEAAIAEGATMVRVGTAIFGARVKRNSKIAE
ncbi:MAG: YggS family pyridoxal phosphate-dependent enzyme [Piscirickettsiaceae bacterium]|nr:MAG: YggS family pyridoxal phosphate-dependent enzyme [Piscirickettsiaceae bacterium]